MRVLTVVPFILLSGAVLAPCAMAQEAPLAKVYACADIEDAGQRHSCFDALIPELKASRAATFGRSTKPAKPQQQADVFGKSASKPSPLTAPVKTPADVKATPAAEKEVDRLSLAVKSISTGIDGKYRFTMENGQIWRQVDTEKLRNLGSGPWTAEIRKAALGSFLLTVGGQPRPVRVQRMN
jgi:hypothetical protein